MDLCLCEICHIAVTFDKCKCYTRGWIRKGKTSVRGKQLVGQETWKKQTRRSIISCCWKYFTPSYIIVCHPATKTNFLVSKHTPFCRQYQNVSVTFYIDKVEQELVTVKIYRNYTLFDNPHDIPSLKYKPYNQDNQSSVTHTKRYILYNLLQEQNFLM